MHKCLSIKTSLIHISQLSAKKIIPNLHDCAWSNFLIQCSVNVMYAYDFWILRNGEFVILPLPLKLAIQRRSTVYTLLSYLYVHQVHIFFTQVRMTSAVSYMTLNIWHSTSVYVFKISQWKVVNVKNCIKV
jgi:hypothetical protein